MTTRRTRAGRAVRRAAVGARRACVSLFDIDTMRYPGGVDPVTVTGTLDRGKHQAGDAAVTTTVTGSARSRGGRLVSVVVTVDHTAVGIGLVSEADHRATDRATPWRAAVQVPTDRNVDVRAIAVYSDGLAQQLDNQWVDPLSSSSHRPQLGHRNAARSQPRGIIESPESGTRVPASLVTVSGWASVDALARTEISVNGAAPLLARQMASPRPDVIPHLASVHSSFSGFECVVDLTNVGTVSDTTIGVTMVDGDGIGYFVGETVVVIQEPADPAPTDTQRVATLQARTARIAKRHQPAVAGVRLLAVTHDLDVGGGQLYLQELLFRLLEYPDVQMLVVSQTDGPLRDELEALGVEVHIVGTYPTDPVAYESLLRGLVYVAGDFEATVVVANTAGAMCGVGLADRIGVPALWAIHESYAPDHFPLAAYGPNTHPSVGDRLNDALASAAAVIFEAEATRRLYCTHGDPRRFLRIGYGIPIDAIDAFQAADDQATRRAELGWSDDDVVLLCIGTLEPRKAQASLLRAFARVAPDHPEAVLVLVGDRGDWYGEGLRAYATRLGLGDRIRIEDVSPDSYDWYALADAFVLASDVESLPRSVLEAMAFGVPTAVADVFGLSDLIDDGNTGLLFAPRDLKLLESALRRLLTMTPSEREALGARGAAHIRSEYDSRGYASAFRRLIDGFATDATTLPGAFL